MAKRVFVSTNPKSKAEDYHGGGRFERVLPNISDAQAVVGGVKSVNLELTFEEALKLSLAIDSCLQKLNRYNRGTSEGRGMGMLLSIKMENSSVAVIEKKVKKN